MVNCIAAVFSRLFLKLSLVFRQRYFHITTECTFTLNKRQALATETLTHATKKENKKETTEDTELVTGVHKLERINSFLLHNFWDPNVARTHM